MQLHIINCTRDISTASTVGPLHISMSSYE